MNDSQDVSKGEFTPFTILTEKCFKVLASKRFVFVSMIILMVLAIYFDRKNGGVVFVEKAGTVMAFFGVLITVKHRFLTSISLFSAYFHEARGSGVLGSSHVNDQEYERVRGMAEEECIGLWMILFGTLLSVLSLWAEVFF